ncbi:MAG: glycosyltransferase family 4 protein [Anaerolineae bacterium]
MANRHRVLYVESAPSVGGSVISLYELLRGLDRTRYEPIVVTYTRHEYVDKFRALGVEVIAWDVYQTQEHRPAWVSQVRSSWPVQRLRRTTWGSSFYHNLGFSLFLVRKVWPLVQALRHVIVQRGVHLVHTNTLIDHDRAGILAAKLTGRPCVCHIRDFDTLNWFDRKLAQMADQLIYISEIVQRRYVEAEVPSYKGRVIYNGLDVAAFINALDRDRGRQIFCLGPNDLAVGMVGRLEPWKGQEVFLKAMALLQEMVPNVKGIIVGDPPPYRPEYRQVLQSLCDSLGLSSRVLFNAFRVDVPVVMSALDVVVLASVTPEPFGRVLIEAMAAGKPVVATNCGAASEIVQDGVHGLLVPPADANAMAHAIAYLLMHRDEAEVMGRRGRSRVEAQFHLKQYVDGVQAIYEGLLH